MMNDGLAMPLAATMDLQYRLPPFQQILYTPSIIVSFVLLVTALVVVIYLSHRAKARAKSQSRLEALKMAEKILLKRGGDLDDVNRMLYVFKANPRLDPAAVIMIREKFHNDVRPILESSFDAKFGERMELLYFPPPKDTRRAVGTAAKDIGAAHENQKTTANSQAAAAIIDFMDATLKPGTIARLTFEGVEGGFECLIMGHDMQAINLTLPANNEQLVSSIRPGMQVEGSLQSGPSLLAFTSVVIQAVAGSMPYCRITAWTSAWEVRKRDSVRLPISLEIDFQHISTSSTDNIRMSNLDREIGSVRPGRLMDLSLGGCGIETQSGVAFTVGDMIRFSKSLVAGNPPATLLGAIVNVDSLDPGENDGYLQRLHVQFLVIDDVSQRMLVRTLRQLQDAAERDEWMQAQHLLQKMRRNRISPLGSPSGPARRESTGSAAKTGTRPAGAGQARTGTRAIPRPSIRGAPKGAPDGAEVRQSSRSVSKTPPARPSTRSFPKLPPPPGK